MAKETKPPKTLSPELQPLQDLYELMLEEGLDSVELKDEETRIKLTRRLSAPAGVMLSHAPALHRVSEAKAPAAAKEEAVEAGTPANAITSPLAGVFYRASSPTTAPFAKEGDIVDAGQTLCIIEAMKVMNEIKAETHGRIVKILVENARPVTAGQALFQFDPA